MRFDFHYHYHMDREMKACFQTLSHQVKDLERKIDKRMGELNQTVAAIQDAANSNFNTLQSSINEGFTSLEQTVTTEIGQVRTILEQNNDVQGALTGLRNLEGNLSTGFQTARDTITAGFAAARQQVSAIAPDEPAEETPANDSPESSEDTEAASGS